MNHKAQDSEVVTNAVNGQREQARLSLGGLPKNSPHFVCPEGGFLGDSGFPRGLEFKLKPYVAS